MDLYLSHKRLLGEAFDPQTPTVEQIIMKMDAEHQNLFDKYLNDYLQQGLEVGNKLLVATMYAYYCSVKLRVFDSPNSDAKHNVKLADKYMETIIPFVRHTVKSDSIILGRLLGHHGCILKTLAKYDEAEKVLHEELEIGKSANYDFCQIDALLWLCDANIKKENYFIAQTYADQMITFKLDEKYYGIWLSLSGNVLKEIGEYEKAYERHNLRKELAMRQNDLRGEGLADHHLGEIHHALGHYDKAIEHFQRFETCAQTDPNGVDFGAVGIARRSIGESMLNQAAKLPKKRLSILDQALTMFKQHEASLKKSDDRKQLCLALRRIANVHRCLGVELLRQDRNKAMSHFKSAADHICKQKTIATHVSALLSLSDGLYEFGELHAALGSFAVADQAFTESIRIDSYFPPRKETANTWYARGRYLHMQAMSEKEVSARNELLYKAKEILQQGIQLCDRLSLRLKREAYQIAFVDTLRLINQELISVLYNSGRYEDALLHCERYRCISLKNQLQIDSITIQGIKQVARDTNRVLLVYYIIKYDNGKEEVIVWTVTPEGLIHSYKRPCSVCSEIFYANGTLQHMKHASRGGVMDINIQSFDDQIQKELQHDLQTNFKVASVVEKPTPMSKQETEHLFSRVDTIFKNEIENIELPEAAINMDESQEEELDMAELDEIERDTMRGDDNYIVKNTPKLVQRLRSLYQILIAPVKGYIKDRCDITVVSHDHLLGVPWNFLIDESNKFLCRTMCFVNVPSVSVLSSIHRRNNKRYINKPSHVLAFANPEPMPINHRTGKRHEQLDSAEKETRAILALMPESPTPLFRTDATKDNLLQSLRSDIEYLHIATHSFVHQKEHRLDTHGKHCSFAVSDEYCTNQEWENIKIKAHTVTMSSCESHGGPTTEEGVLDWSRTFLRCGASTIVASMWPVPDKSTRKLMKRFYSAMLQENKTASRAMMSSINFLIPDTGIVDVEQVNGMLSYGGFVVVGDDTIY
jgi:CHAT domain-containing protein